MQRSDRPLNKLFDAARQEQSPLSEDDVRALLNQPQKTKRRPVMIPILIATAIVTIAGVTTSVVLKQNETTLAKSAATETKRTPAKLEATSSVEGAATTEVELSNVAVTARPSGERHTKVVVRTNRDDDGDDNESTMSFFTVGNESTSPALCRVRSIFPSAPGRLGEETPNVFFATISANHDVTSRLSDPSAPVPVLCTDNRGRACSSTDVAFFPADYQAMAGNLNQLVPVTYAGREDILVWYTPSAELVEAFPDSMQDELVTLLDIDIDMEFDLPNAQALTRIYTPTQNLYNTDPMKFDSLMGVLKHHLKSGDSIDALSKAFRHFPHLGATVYPKDFDFNALMYSDSSFKALHLGDSAVFDFDFMMKQPHMIATLRNMDSTMKMLQLYYGNDSLNRIPSELLEQYNGERREMTPEKKVFKFRKKMRLDSTANGADSNVKQRFQSRIVIKSTTKRNKNSQALPSVEKLSELTPTANGAIISTNVYPNPATDGGATMSFVLSEPRTLKLTLLDLSGNVVATLMTDAKRTPGNGQFAFTLNNIPSGMYLATLTTDKGERAMQRLIVQ